MTALTNLIKIISLILSVGLFASVPCSETILKNLKTIKYTCPNYQKYFETDPYYDSYWVQDSKNNFFSLKFKACDKEQSKTMKDACDLFAGLSDNNILIVNKKSFEESNGFCYYATEIAIKGTLKFFFEENPIDLKKPVTILKDFESLVRAVKALHLKKLVHRNLHLDSFYVTGSFIFKLGNFEYLLSTADTKKKKVFTEIPIETGFIDDEVVVGKALDFSFDLHSLGIILYQMTHKMEFPFTAKGEGNEKTREKIKNGTYPIKKETPFMIAFLIHQLLLSKAAERMDTTTLLDVVTLFIKDFIDKPLGFENLSNKDKFPNSHETLIYDSLKSNKALLKKIKDKNLFGPVSTPLVTQTVSKEVKEALNKAVAGVQGASASSQTMKSPEVEKLDVSTPPENAETKIYEVILTKDASNAKSPEEPGKEEEPTVEKPQEEITEEQKVEEPEKNKKDVDEELVSQIRIR